MNFSPADRSFWSAPGTHIHKSGKKEKRKKRKINIS